MKRKTSIALAALWFAALSSFAQNNGLPDKAGDQLKMLLQFNGRWEASDAVMKTGGKEYTFTYTTDFKIASDNHAIVMHEWADIPELGKFDGNNLAGVSMSDGKIHWYSVDNMGTLHEHIGEFSDAKHFSMTYTSIQDGKEFIETLKAEFTSANMLLMNVTATLGGDEIVTITGNFKRKK